MALADYDKPSNWRGGAVGSGDYIGPKYLVLDTDDTTPAFMGEGAEFEHLYYENGGNVYPWPAFDFQASRKAIAGILKMARRGDWIIIDLISRFYDQARDYIGELKQIDRNDEAIKRSLENKGFGEGDVGFWNLVSISHDSVTNGFLLNDDVQANVLALAHTTDVVVEREKREVTVMFDDVGIKPKGRPTNAAAMHTVIILWSRKVIAKAAGGNKRVPENDRMERFMDIVKDRGAPWGNRINYDMDFYPALQQARRTLKPVQNIQRDEVIERVVLDSPNQVAAPAFEPSPAPEAVPAAAAE